MLNRNDSLRRAVVVLVVGRGGRTRLLGSISIVDSRS